MRKIAGPMVGVGVAVVLALASGLAIAQSGYPDKPIRILVGFSAGVAPDVTSRLFGDKWNETWAKGVAVENVTGAGGNLAVAQVAKSAPDGYTLAMGGNASLVINPNLMDKVGYDPVKDFTYITQVFIVPNLLVVPNDVPGQGHQGADRARQGQGRTISSPATPASAPRSISAPSCSCR
jgi:tripartite-type tricarboxylate transporter receptor subunit TctC